ncbi:hypothetical protein NFI96_008055 [Prochilodus magdalenae]|nr:hypothetical protein NFI96_008055 [Prochilodus magdalenae]
MMSRADELRARQRDRRYMFLSVRFYRAVRDLRPVWKLEDMRLIDCGMGKQPTTLSPSDALVYAIVHDHQEYANYLLNSFPQETLTETDNSSCSALASHITLSVRYGRVGILNSLLEASRQLLIHRPEVGLESGSGQSPLHTACELLQPESVITLLAYGANVHAEDQNGVTPLDAMLQHWGSRQSDAVKMRQCLDTLLMFMTQPRFRMQQALLNDPKHWREAVGKSTYDFLIGKTPQTLVFLTLHSIFRHIPPCRFLNRLHALPIPNSLKPVVGTPREGVPYFQNA